MDDRSYVTTNPAALLAKKLFWQEWSQEIGMKENPTKAQLTA